VSRAARSATTRFCEIYVNRRGYGAHLARVRKELKIKSYDVIRSKTTFANNRSSVCRSKTLFLVVPSDISALAVARIDDERSKYYDDRIGPDIVISKVVEGTRVSRAVGNFDGLVERPQKTHWA
jgi:hypothetical protein